MNFKDKSLDGYGSLCVDPYFVENYHDNDYLKENPDISAIRYSMLPYRQQENISNIPLYGAFLRT